MHAIRHHHTARITAWVLTVCVLATFIPFTAADTDASETVLLFPVLDESESGLKSIAGALTDELQLAIEETKALSCTQFSPHSSLVRRAVAEGRLRQVDVEAAEAASPSMAIFLGNTLNFDKIVIASIQTYEIQEEPRQVKIIAAGQAYDVAQNVDEATGDVIEEPVVDKAFGVAGTSAERAGYEGSNAPLTREAIESAAYKAAMTLAGKAVGQQPDKREASDSWKWFLYALAVGLIIIGINSMSDDAEPAAGPGEKPLPVRNLVIRELDTNLRIRWDPPTATTLTRLHYQVWRSVDGAGFSRLEGQVDPNASAYTDINMLEGTHIYEYRVRVIYTNNEASDFKTTGAHEFTR
ncbi:MAG: fibronectin type III domain-containing protein [Armatimonadota bacterium]